MKKALALLLAMIMVIGMLAGCGTTGGGEAEGTTSDTFTMAYNGVVTLNSVMTQASNDHNVLYLLQAQLVRYYDGQVEKDAAESYEMSEDATVWTFHLRDGLVWSNGEALTAADYAYGVKCLLDPGMGSPQASSWTMIKNAEKFMNGEVAWEEVGVKVIDEKTIEFTLEQPLTSFDQTVACKHIYPLNQAFVESVGVNNLGSSIDTIMYSGGYTMTEWVLESSITLQKNPSYWDAENQFQVETIKLLEVEDPNTEVAMFENGEVDAIEEMASQYYDHLADYRYDNAGGGFMFLWMNTHGYSEGADKVMGNVNFRKALSYAIDRDATCLAVDSATKAANNPIDPNFPGINGGKFVDEYPIETYPTNGDVAKAQEYLTKAMEELGYADVSEIPALTIVTWDTAIQKTLGEALTDQWKQNLGVDVQLEQYVIGTAIGKFYEQTYDIFLITWETDVKPTDLLQAMTSTGEANPGIWANAEFDQLVADAIAEVDPAKQAELTQKAAQVMIDDAGIIPLHLNGTVHAKKEYVDGFVIGVSDGFQFSKLVVNK
ncbi:MAG: peptide ABC transporter substrate-binding protein [Firmicutes bacterium]|nr:peptide ABC transporter substrate-binding protein [Bacillota bacterium]